MLCSPLPHSRYSTSFPGALFALEVLHTMGMQFFDVAVYAVGSGGVCLAVYRGLQGEEFGEIWAFPDSPLSSATEVVLGAVVGAIAGGVGIAFRRCAFCSLFGSWRVAVSSPPPEQQWQWFVLCSAQLDQQ